jgi:hypothetical protein
LHLTRIEQRRAGSRVNADEICQRLAQLTLLIEEHAAAIWRLELEREDLRTELRRLNNAVTQPERRSAVLPRSSAP